jgi:mannose-6-phosphate isomerase-like protein (cupin superfamily)
MPDSVPPIGRATDGLVIAPDGSDVRLLLDGQHGASRCSLVEVSIEAGAVSRPVRHRSVEEAWYVLAGTGRVWRCPPDSPVQEAAPVSVAPGDALVIPAGWAFQFAADAGQPLRFLCVTMPPWPGMDEAEIVEEGGLGQPTLLPP